MTKYLVEEIGRCKNDPAEFIKYITDEDIGSKMSAVFDVNLGHMYFKENMNIYIACLSLWKCIFYENYDICIFTKDYKLISAAIHHIMDNLPNFLKVQFTHITQKEFRIGNNTINILNNPNQACGRSINLGIIVNDSSFSEKVSRELRIDVFPVILSRPNGTVVYVNGEL